MMPSNKHDTVWATQGKDKNYEHYRLSKSDTSKVLRDWVDDAYFKKNLAQFLDKDFVHNLQDEDFFGRLWELELAEWFMISGLEMVATNSKGPDFCLKLSDDSKIWIEATLARSDEDLEEIWRKAIASKGKLYETPRQETALRYSTSLVGKANKIKEKYSDLISKDDYVLIAVSAFSPGSLRSDIDLFMLSVLPIEHQVIYFTTDGSSLDDQVPRPTHTSVSEYTKKSGSKVKKEFLFPGNHFPFIDGVLFSEASNLQQLLGTFSTSFDETTNRPHVFANYAGKALPSELTDHFYSHKFVNNGEMASLVMEDPTAS